LLLRPAQEIINAEIPRSGTQLLTNTQAVPVEKDAAEW